jgi:hypothetical protein
MQAEADAHRLGLELGTEYATPSVCEAHGFLCRFGGYSHDSAMTLLSAGGEGLAGQVNAAVLESRHLGPSGVRRALAVVLADHERRKPGPPIAPAADDVPPAQPLGDGTAGDVE